jgi:hypothetical protein
VSYQPSLLDRVERVERPRKRVRAVSKQVYAELRDTGRLVESNQKALTALAAYYNRFAVWPTTRELVQWMFEDGRLPAPSGNLVSGRFTFLTYGIKRTLKDGTVIHEGGGVCEFLPKRTCRVSGKSAHPIRIREAGSLLDPHSYGGRN